jgi:hypothetical protein
VDRPAAALLAWSFAGSLPVRAAAGKTAQDNCLDCHGDKDFSKDGPGGAKVSLFVDADRFGKAVHASLKCRDCHAGLDDSHQDGSHPPAKVACGNCHAEESKVYQGSIHGMSKAMGASAAASCVDCHGNHYIVPVSQPDSPVYKMNLPVTCNPLKETPCAASSSSPPSWPSPWPPPWPSPPP